MRSPQVTTRAPSLLCYQAAMTQHLATLLHLIGFAAFLGAAFAQQQFMKRSAEPALNPTIRDEYERLSAVICTRIELPALFAQVFVGIYFIVDNPAYLKQHWLHGKLTAVVLLLALAHAEMFNARRLVRARAERGDSARSEIAARKSKHALMGNVATVLVLATIVLAVFKPGL
jgi:uncharacterized membrane protein